MFLRFPSSLNIFKTIYKSIWLFSELCVFPAHDRTGRQQSHTLSFRAVSLMQDVMPTHNGINTEHPPTLPPTPYLKSSLNLSRFLTSLSNLVWCFNRPLISLARFMICKPILASIWSNCWINSGLISLVSVASVCACHFTK